MLTGRPATELTASGGLLDQWYYQLDLGDRAVLLLLFIRRPDDIHNESLFVHISEV